MAFYKLTTLAFAVFCFVFFKPVSEMMDALARRIGMEPPPKEKRSKDLLSRAAVSAFFGMLWPIFVPALVYYAFERSSKH